MLVRSGRVLGASSRSTRRGGAAPAGRVDGQTGVPIPRGVEGRAARVEGLEPPAGPVRARSRRASSRNSPPRQGFGAALTTWLLAGMVDARPSNLRPCGQLGPAQWRGRSTSCTWYRARLRRRPRWRRRRRQGTCAAAPHPETPRAPTPGGSGTNWPRSGRRSARCSAATGGAAGSCRHGCGRWGFPLHTLTCSPQLNGIATAQGSSCREHPGTMTVLPQAPSDTGRWTTILRVRPSFTASARVPNGRRQHPIPTPVSTTGWRSIAAGEELASTLCRQWRPATGRSAPDAQNRFRTPPEMPSARLPLHGRQSR